MRSNISYFKNIIFPMINNIEAEKKLDAKIEKLNSMDSVDIYNYPLEYVKIDKESKIDNVIEEYKDSISRIKIFEDKAKSNLIAISISVTIILGLAKPLNEIYLRYDNVYVKFILFIISILAVFFMLYGGNVSLKVLMDKNIIYKVRCIELKEESNEELKKIYGMYGELNEINNTKRNNYINTSYQCIRNALVLLTLIFIIGIAPSLDMENEENMLKGQLNDMSINLERINEENKKINETLYNQNKRIKVLEKENIIQK